MSGKCTEQIVLHIILLIRADIVISLSDVSFSTENLCLGAGVKDAAFLHFSVVYQVCHSALFDLDYCFHLSVSILIYLSIQSDNQ